MDTNIANKSLLEIREVFDEFKIPLIITAGALLGIVRENRLLPWDHDLDLWTLPTSSYINIRNAMEKLEKLNFIPWELFKIPSGKIVHWTFHRGDFNIGIKVIHPTKDEKFMCATGIFWGRRKGVTLTLIPKHLISPPAQIKFLDKMFLVPNPPEEYLKIQYGDWKVTIKDNSFLAFRSWDVYLVKDCPLSPWENVIRIDMPARIELLKEQGKWKGK